MKRNYHDFLNVVDSQVIYQNGKVIGDILQDVDGYHLFFPAGDGGWNAAVLEMVAQLLKDIDHDWDAEITEFFTEEGTHDE